MKKLLLLTALSIFITAVKAQFSVTPEGFVNAKESNKDFLVIDFVGKSQGDLYKSTLTYLNSLYVSPKDVLSTVENSSITVHAIAKNTIKRNSMHVFDLEYTLNIEFKDNKIKVAAPSVEMSNYYNGTMQHIHFVYGTDLTGGNFGIYNKKGELRLEKAKEGLESYFNSYVSNLTAALVKPAQDW